MQSILQNFTHINKMERLVFHIIKPFGWILFILAIVPFFVFLGFFIANLVSYLNVLQQTNNANTSIIWYQENVVNVINYIVFYFNALIINIFILLGLRSLTKIFLVFRTINQYISYAYQTYHNTSKLIVTLIILSVGLCFIVISIFGASVFLFWMSNIFITSSNIINANNSFDDIKELLFTEINQINNYQIKQQTTFILLIVGLGGWLITNIVYFFYIICFVPRQHELIEDEWKFVEMYNQMQPNANQKKYGPSSSYDEYNNRLTNGFSHRNNLRDKQYEIYRTYNKTNK